MSYVQQKIHPQGLEYLEIKSPMCNAHIFFQGGQVTYFKPNNKPPLLWSSQAETYEDGRAS